MARQSYSGTIGLTVDTPAGKVCNYYTLHGRHRYSESEGEMTKAEIIEAVYDKSGGLSKKEAGEVVESIFNTIKKTLEAGENIKVSGFGNFVVRDKTARVGRNPQTGEEITISSRRVLTFKPSQVLKKSLND